MVVAELSDGRHRGRGECVPYARYGETLDAVAAAITGLSELATELGDVLEALDINPLICGPDRAVAVDALAVPRQPAP